MDMRAIIGTSWGDYPTIIRDSSTNPLDRTFGRFKRMPFVLSRFIFGFGMVLIIAVILLVVTIACLKFIRYAVGHLVDERDQDIANGIAVFAATVLILLGCYSAAHMLSELLGQGALAQGVSQQLAGGNQISAAVAIGAVVAVGLMAGLPSLLRRRYRRTEASNSTPAKKPARISDKKDKQIKVRQPTPRTSYSATLNWMAILLLLLGVCLLLFAYVVTPSEIRAMLLQSADVLDTEQIDNVSRARFVFYVAGAVLGVGALLLLISRSVNRSARV